MSELSPQQLEIFWGVYADFQKEKDAITGARIDLAKKYADNFQNVSDADITALVTESANLQKKTTDLRVKYFGILSQKLNAHAAGRFTLIDDYTTTAGRLNLLEPAPDPDRRHREVRLLSDPRPTREALPDHGERLAALGSLQNEPRRAHPSRIPSRTPAARA